MSNVQSSNESKTSVKPDMDPATSAQEPDQDEDEFKITVKKLDTVIRPRGVLAE